MENKRIGENIKNARECAGLTQKELAALIGKSKSSVQKYEQGSVEIPGSVLDKIADATNTKRLFIDGHIGLDEQNATDESQIKRLLPAGYTYYAVLQSDKGASVIIRFPDGFLLELYEDEIVRFVQESENFAKYRLNELRKEIEKGPDRPGVSLFGSFKGRKE